MKHCILLMLAMLVVALPRQARAYDIQVGGLFFNLNPDGKTVTLTYETIILPALDAPAPTARGYVGNLVIPSSIKHGGKTYTVSAIDAYTFNCNPQLVSVVVPSSVQTIGESAFGQCYNLKSVILPDNLTEISARMFAESGLHELVIPGKVKRIGSHAFNSCPLKSIAIPNSVTDIGQAAFGACRWLQEVKLGKSVKTIGDAAFSICPQLSAINLPSSLKEIGDKAFNECASLTDVTIPASVDKVGDGAFNNCQALSKLTVDKANKTYDSRDGCNAIIETASNTLIVGCDASTVPPTVTAIGPEAFAGCSGLTRADLPASVTTIGYRAYYYCQNIRALSLPESVRTIGSYAFVGCDSLETVTIPNSVTTISYGAFLHDDHIKRLTIGSAVTLIDTWAFKGLDAVTSLTSNIRDVSQVKMGEDVFDEIDKSACTLYVPTGTASQYKAAPQWSDFKHIVER